VWTLPEVLRLSLLGAAMLRCMAPLCRRLAILSHRPLRADGVSLATSNRTPDGIRLRGTDVPFESIALWLQGPLSTYRRTARLRTIDGRLGNERLANGLATPSVTVARI